MSENSIHNSKHRAKVDNLITQSTDVSMIRDLLVLDGIDCFTYQEISEYVADYLKSILKDSGIQHQHLKRELDSSYQLALSKDLDSNAVVMSCATMLELDILRLEKLTQQVFANQRLNVDLRSLERVIKMKNALIKNRLLIQQYEFNKANQYNPAAITLDASGPSSLDSWMETLETDKAEVVLQALELMAEDQSKKILS